MCISTSFRFLFSLFFFFRGIRLFIFRHHRIAAKRLWPHSMRVCMPDICAVCQLWFDQMKIYERICMVRTGGSVKLTKTLTRPRERWWWILLNSRVHFFFSIFFFASKISVVVVIVVGGWRRWYCCRKFRCVWHDLVSHFGHSFSFYAFDLCV